MLSVHSLRDATKILTEGYVNDISPGRVALFSENQM